MSVGRDLLTGKPKQVEVSYEIAKALDKSIQRIEENAVISQTPPELAADIYNTGIFLAGGGSMLRGLDKESPKNGFTCLHCRIL
jgi:rod shape-determining protein MreB